MVDNIKYTYSAMKYSVYYTELHFSPFEYSTNLTMNLTH